ncbi:hypothetical protein M514_01325 [Trichuris suis]|uniref:Uncharacterized protein n=1 Tax=Trichuris suis TaxID=68888 RepID=A0A085NS15_9BILA|nr:hypothetical protein M513_01325 [Trichuris suis]KFD72261.1 hypothetical protein M514_01325 [Trichuris suis]KHJ49352.1 hypothetical protein D918_00477 [Trichuris suis]
MAEQGDNSRRCRRFSPVLEDSEGIAHDSSLPIPDQMEQYLYEVFISVANAVTELFRTPGWNSFSKSAAATTRFYKGSCEAYRRAFDIGLIRGRQLQCKELLAWLRSYNCPFIRREDLELQIANKLDLPRQIAGTLPEAVSASSLRTGPPSPAKEQADTMVMFSEALSVPQDLSAFFQEAYFRHGKRRNSHNLDDFDTAVRKRQRRC